MVCLSENSVEDPQGSEGDGEHPIFNNDDDSYMEVGASTTKRFNFLVVGGTGLGKTTFSNMIAQRYFPSFTKTGGTTASSSSPTKHIEERVRCEKTQGSTRIIVTIVDTPGFGDSMNNKERITPVLKYMEDQNLRYEEGEEYRYPLHQQNDSRVHCCFYFIMPHRVTALDGEFLRCLQSKAPIVPVLAKTDTLMTEELEEQLFRVHCLLREEAIHPFDFQEQNIDDAWLDEYAKSKTSEATQEDREEDDQRDANENEVPRETKTMFERVGLAMNESSSVVFVAPPVDNDAAILPTEQIHVYPVRRQIPNVFAVISGQRAYPWGLACQDDPLHSDTPRLHNVLFKDTSKQSLSRLKNNADKIHHAWQRQHSELAKQIAQEKSFKEKRAQRTLFAVMLAFVILAFVLLVWFPEPGRTGRARKVHQGKKAAFW